MSNRAYRSLGMRLLLLLLLSSLLSASDPWTTNQKLGEAAYAVLLFVDWKQTSAFHRQGIEEANTILGRHPSQQTINLSCAGSLLGHLIITDLLPSELRAYWLWLTVGVEAWAVGQNFTLGVRIVW